MSHSLCSAAHLGDLYEEALFQGKVTIIRELKDSGATCFMVACFFFITCFTSWKTTGIWILVTKRILFVCNMFMSRESIGTFQCFWICYHNHPIRTESNRTPLQLWVEGQHNYQPIQNDLITDTDMETYGIDWERPLPSETFSSPNDQDTGISIPEFSSPLFDHLALEIDPLQESDSNGVDVHSLLRDYVKQFLE